MWEMTCTINNLQGEILNIICRLHHTLQIHKLIFVASQKETGHIHLFAFFTHSAERKVPIIVDGASPILWKVYTFLSPKPLIWITIFQPLKIPLTHTHKELKIASVSYFVTMWICVFTCHTFSRKSIFVSFNVGFFTVHFMQVVETLVDNTEIFFESINFRQIWKLAKVHPSEKASHLSWIQYCTHSTAFDLCYHATEGSNSKSKVWHRSSTSP